MSSSKTNTQSSNPNGAHNYGHADYYDTDKRTQKRVSMACLFCRNRKLKCDGARPSCAHCNHRQLTCTYQPVNHGNN
ncbi:hypothetical protein BDZ89DRAFT_1125661 [Hymenopellis radicata]|nr:hypothetical protein BDZ89DRAFT_1125661 [Hymenopellis radicata]